MRIALLKENLKAMKNSKKRIQIQKVLDELKQEPATSMMLSVRTGVLRCNCTRYLSKLEDQGKVTVVKEDNCSVTGHKAKYYSAREEDFPPQTQSSLFPNRGCRV
ncbi:MAG: hypothetical protein HUJ22_08810 [Gracilimonas sp.]|uniref:hypothetical protein n=1 Tax=Gracilimonas sp. TaxID=1974203 RepID=UPI0019923EF9|nr:hypothetical protein [Gracilimonas sp.]MBD3616661.1 hypothetical protein [Gracilimonas sp.]